MSISRPCCRRRKSEASMDLATRALSKTTSSATSSAEFWTMGLCELIAMIVESCKFYSIPPPTDDDIESLTVKMIRRVLKILRKHEENGCFDSDDEHELLSQEQVHSIRSSYAWIVRDDRESICRYAPLCASIDGFSLHANVAIHNNDREGLERLCRYGLRSSFALSRLRFTDDGNVEYELRRPLPGGSTRMVCTPVEFLRKLAVLIPPPRRVYLRLMSSNAPSAVGECASWHSLPSQTLPSRSSATWT